MKEFTSGWYDKEYFATPEGKEFHLADGSVKRWGYRNPAGEFLGAKEITRAWKEVFNPMNMLDVGAGRGVFIAYARDAGIFAEGFDYSEYAVGDEGRYSRCKGEWLRFHDATKPWPYGIEEFELIVALDFLEHIYLEDLGFVLNELFRVAEKYVFLQTATVDGVREKGYILKRGEEIPLATDGRTWAGHVTVCTEAWWYDRLEREDWAPRRDLVQWFVSLVDPRVIANWLKNSIIILERI